MSDPANLEPGAQRRLDAILAAGPPLAALTLLWNSGPVEGHVNRIKMPERQMFGRAKHGLLRKRVLLADRPHPTKITGNCARSGFQPSLTLDNGAVRRARSRSPQATPQVGPDASQLETQMGDGLDDTHPNDGDA